MLSTLWGKLPVVTHSLPSKLMEVLSAFVQETPPPNILVLLEHPLPEREEVGQSCLSQGLSRQFGACSAHQGALYVLSQAVSKTPEGLGPN